MKKLVLALVCVFLTGSAVAQTYACQFIMAAGMIKDPKGGWRTTEFNVPEPFFLAMSGGLIDSISLVQAPIIIEADSKCSISDFDSPKLGRSHWCSDKSNYLSFSEKTLNGGLAQTMGAMQTMKHMSQS